MPIPLGILAVAGAGAAGAASDYVRLESTILTTTAASVTFSNLNNYSAYKHLQLRITARTDRSGSGDDNIGIRVNSDTGSNYAYHWLTGDGSSVASSATTSTTFAFVGKTAAALATANNFAGNVIDILDFNSSAKNTTFRSLSGQGSDYIRLFSGLWNNTAAVTALLLYPLTGPNFIAGSRFSLYGIK